MYIYIYILTYLAGYACYKMTHNGVWLSRENCFGESPKICSRVDGRLDAWLLWCLGAGYSVEMVLPERT